MPLGPSPPHLLAALGLRKKRGVEADVAPRAPSQGSGMAVRRPFLSPTFLYSIPFCVLLRDDDMTMPVSKMSQVPSQATTTQVLSTLTPAQVTDGPVTRSHAKKLQQEVHALLCEIHFHINENYILPKCCTLIVLRYIGEEKDESDPKDGLANRITRVKNGPVQVPDRLAKRISKVNNGPVKRNLHNLLLTKAMKAHENLLESLSSLLSNASSLISFGHYNQE